MNTGDLLYRICQDNTEVCSSLASGLADLMHPTLVTIDGCLLIKSIGADDIYRNRRSEGLSPSDAQAWANLFEMTETFGLGHEAALKLAGSVRRCWESAIADQRPAMPHFARIACDDDLGEIYVTIDQNAG